MAMDLFQKKIAKLISSKSKFLFINSQINSNNSGQHTLEKFKNANCVLINETEMRHELRDRVSSTKKPNIFAFKKTKIKIYNCYKRGNEGSVFYESRKKRLSHALHLRQIFLIK